MQRFKNHHTFYAIAIGLACVSTCWSVQYMTRGQSFSELYTWTMAAGVLCFEAAKLLFVQQAIRQWTKSRALSITCVVAVAALCAITWGGAYLRISEQAKTHEQMMLYDAFNRELGAHEQRMKQSEQHIQTLSGSIERLEIAERNKEARIQRELYNEAIEAHAQLEAQRPVAPATELTMEALGLQEILHRYWTALIDPIAVLLTILGTTISAQNAQLAAQTKPKTLRARANNIVSINKPTATAERRLAAITALHAAGKLDLKSVQKFMKSVRAHQIPITQPVATEILAQLRNASAESTT